MKFEDALRFLGREKAGAYFREMTVLLEEMAEATDIRVLTLGCQALDRMQTPESLQHRQGRVS